MQKKKQTRHFKMSQAGDEKHFINFISPYLEVKNSNFTTFQKMSKCDKSMYGGQKH